MDIIKMEPGNMFIMWLTLFRLKISFYSDTDTSPAPFQDNSSPYPGMSTQYVPNLGASPNHTSDIQVQYPIVTGITQFSLNPATASNSTHPQVW